MFPEDTFTILPPLNSEELGFEDVSNEAEIEGRLRTIVGHKHADVLSQPEYLKLKQSGYFQPTQSPPALLQIPPIVVVADTTVIAADGNGMPRVLGQPEAVRWQDEVRDWLRTYLSGKTHQVWTCFRVSCGEIAQEHVVRSGVTFVPLTDHQIDWYLSTGESLGKAGGYAIQGYGAALVCGLQGSLTNVIGLPLMEVSQCIRQVESDANAQLSRSPLL